MACLRRSGFGSWPPIERATPRARWGPLTRRTRGRRRRQATEVAVGPLPDDAANLLREYCPREQGRFVRHATPTARPSRWPASRSRVLKAHGRKRAWRGGQWKAPPDAFFQALVSVDQNSQHVVVLGISGLACCVQTSLTRNKQVSGRRPTMPMAPARRVGEGQVRRDPRPCRVIDKRPYLSALSKSRPSWRARARPRLVRGMRSAPLGAACGVVAPRIRERRPRATS